MKHFERRQMLINFSHEAFHEDHLGQTDRQAAQVARERVHVVEVMKLHCVRKIQS